MIIDLHIHSIYSDGTLNYDEIINLAKKNNVDIISITDHDTIINLKNYKLYREKYNMNIIPGLEISSNIKNVHILGYGINNFEKLEKVLIDLKIENEGRNKESIEILKKNGIDIDFERVKEISKNGIVTYRDVVEYLYLKKYIVNRHDAFKKYIGKGAIAYVPSREMSIIEILDLIDSVGGISSLAHPCLINDNIDDIIKEMVYHNLSGIEINKDRIKPQQYYKYIEYAKKYNLCITRGSDFHDSKLNKLGGEVEDDFLDSFQKKLIFRR